VSGGVLPRLVARCCAQVKQNGLRARRGLHSRVGHGAWTTPQEQWREIRCAERLAGPSESPVQVCGSGRYARVVSVGSACHASAFRPGPTCPADQCRRSTRWDVDSDCGTSPPPCHTARLVPPWPRSHVTPDRHPHRYPGTTRPASSQHLKVTEAVGGRPTDAERKIGQCPTLIWGRGQRQGSC
jgi:hypothetical protein